MRKPSSRRRFLAASAACSAAPSLGAAPVRQAAGFYARLGVRPVINGVGTVTYLGGCILPPEVWQAMEEASRHFVNMMELQKKAGARIASLIGVPAAMITAGAASAIAVATSACMARDTRKVAQLPDTSGLRHEIIQQKSHRSGYEAQMLLNGGRIVWVETRAEAERAISERTAMMFFLNKADPDGSIRREEWIAIGKAHGVPTFNDAAADVPPASRLSEYVREGFDLVAFSGGKGLLGPQASGLLLGREDLIEVARLAISPHGGIGRGMKVGKEEIAGLVAAVERYLKVDHAAEARVLEDRAAHLLSVLSKVRGITARRDVPEIANRVPHVVIEWDAAARGRTAQDVIGKLLEGEPPIAVSPNGRNGLRVSTWMLRGDEHKTVARRLAEELAG